MNKGPIHYRTLNISYLFQVPASDINQICLVLLDLQVSIFLKNSKTLYILIYISCLTYFSLLTPVLCMDVKYNMKQALVLSK